MTQSPSLRVFTTDDPMPVDYPFHLSRVKIGEAEEEIRERVLRIHSHEYLQILMVLDGSILHESGGEKKVLAKGELVCIPAFQKHRDFYEIGAEVVTISFMPSIVDSLFANPHLLGRSGHFSEAFLASFFLPSNVELRVIAPKPEEVNRFIEVIEKMSLEQAKQDSMGRLKLHTHVMSFLSLLQEVSGFEELDGLSSPSQPLELTLNHIQKHYYEDVSVERLIENSGISATLFRKEFKAATGRSCLQYLNELRVFHAITAIRNTERPLKEIASDVGFSEFETFHRVFKRVKGVGPKAFRDGLNSQLLKTAP